MITRKPLGPRLVERDVIVPGLDPAHDGVKIAHLTDLHVGMLTPAKKILRALEMAQAAKPDLLLLTGDFVCYSPKFVGRLAELTRGDRACRPTACSATTTTGPTERACGARSSATGWPCCATGTRRSGCKHSLLTIVGIDDAITGHADVQALVRRRARRAAAASC